LLFTSLLFFGIYLAGDPSATPPDALWQQAMAAQYGLEGEVKNHAQAACLLERLVTMEPPHPLQDRALLELGRMHAFGLHGAVNASEAVAWFQKAAAAGSVDAFVELAWAHLLGQGLSENTPEAIVWLQKAVDQGDSRAQWLLQNVRDLAEEIGRPGVSSPQFFRTLPLPERYTEPILGMKFLLVEPGELGITRFGADAPEIAIPYQLSLPTPYYLGQYEVTVADWRQIMGFAAPYPWHQRAAMPITGINYFMAQCFVRRLNFLNPGMAFRLPTEDEWEYACRAGTTTPFHTGQHLPPGMANVDFRVDFVFPFAGEYRGGTTPVGSYPANAFGFYDMHGNAAEWCLPTPENPPNPFGQDGHLSLRGGSWYFSPQIARSGFRDTHRPQDLGRSTGFRLVVAP